LQIKWLQTNGCDALIEAAGLHREVTEEEFLFVSRKNDFKKILVQAGDKLEKIMTNHRLHVITYVSLLKKEANLFAASETKEQWHNRRKQIKQLLYALHWLKKEERLKLLPLQLYKQYDCLQEMIGQWHDATERETKLQGELLYLHTEPTVNLQYNLCILQLKNEQQDCEKKITQLLSNK
jgi:CHAD domain-containing protein